LSPLHTRTAVEVVFLGGGVGERPCVGYRHQYRDLLSANGAEIAIILEVFVKKKLPMKSTFFSRKGFALKMALVPPT